MENDFNRQYSRQVETELPAGYSVRNLQDLNLDVRAGPDPAAPVYYFRSAYTQQGQKLVVTSTEAYQ